MIYGDFNLPFLDGEGLWFVASDRALILLESGVYATLDTPWSKVAAVKSAWQDETLEQAMSDETEYADALLPKAGISL